MLAARFIIISIKPRRRLISGAASGMMGFGLPKASGATALSEEIAVMSRLFRNIQMNIQNCPSRCDELPAPVANY